MVFRIKGTKQLSGKSRNIRCPKLHYICKKKLAYAHMQTNHYLSAHAAKCMCSTYAILKFSCNIKQCTPTRRTIHNFPQGGSQKLHCSTIRLSLICAYANQPARVEKMHVQDICNIYIFHCTKCNTSRRPFQINYGSPKARTFHQVPAGN